MPLRRQKGRGDLTGGARRKGECSGRGGCGGLRAFLPGGLSGCRREALGVASLPGDDLRREGRLPFWYEFALRGKSVGAGLPWLNWLRRGLCPLFARGSVWAGNWVLAGEEGAGFGLQRLGSGETAY